MDKLTSYIINKGFTAEPVDDKFLRINGYLFSAKQSWIEARRREGNLDEIMDITLRKIKKYGKKEAEQYEDYEDIFKEFGASTNI